MRYGQTEIHPLALLLTLGAAIALLSVRRDRTVLTVLVVACFVTHAQRVVIAGIDFSMLRLLMLVGWLRVFMRGETAGYRYHPIDAVLLVWQFFATIAFIFGPRASVETFVWRIGLTLDSVGMYFLFRVLLRDVRDVQRALAGFSWIALILILPMAVEWMTGRNAFSAFGGVNEITKVRDGRLRCQASFSHPIMAGNFGASSAALIGSLWLALPRQRLFHGAGLAAAVGVTLLSSSSGPLMALVGAMLGWGIWNVRQHMRSLRWSVFSVLALLQLSMDKPIWHLIGRLGKVTGGTGFHRYKLIDEFVSRVGEWWLVGTGSTQHWDFAVNSADITNHYALEGIRGGMGAFLSFIAVIVLAFRSVGQSLRRVAAIPGLPKDEVRRLSLITWGLGVCLFVHAIAFIGVSYFGQMMAIFFLHLAMIPSMQGGIARQARGMAARREAARVAAPPRRGVVPGLGAP